MKRKARTADYFNFSRRERFGLLTLCFLILASSILPHITPRGKLLLTELTDTAWLQKTIPKNNVKPESEPSFGDNMEPLQSRRLFPFDPNMIVFEDWQKLGLKKKTILTILNYTSKGGKFRKPEDLKRIYGLSEEDFVRLKPYIIIPSPTAVQYEKKVFEKNYTKQTSIIDINTADTTAFIALPGIGSKLASRIVSFREKLGGFYAIEQVREVYGLHDSVFMKIASMLTLASTSVKTLDINSATFELLSAHPYIRKEKAGMIINYRNEHGKFESVDDLKMIHGIKAEEVNKMRAYLMVQ